MLAPPVFSFAFRAKNDSRASIPAIAVPRPAEPGWRCPIVTAPCRMPASGVELPVSPGRRNLCTGSPHVSLWETCPLIPLRCRRRPGHVLGARQLQASGVPCVSGVTVMHILKLSLLIDALTGVGFGTGRWAWLAVPTGSTKEGNVSVSGRQWGQTVPRAFSKATGWPQTDAPAITLPGPRSPAEEGVTAQRGRGAGCPSEAGTGPWKPGQAMLQAPPPSTDSAFVHTANLPAWWPGGLVSGMVEDSVARMFRPILRPHH